ncbi:hypothetical protein B9Z19DRAFT_1129211 [Tuber borchii]|uniref:Uncharacterized protein n=1 Tax=Tuber borchii TaxID=42251 RepID=A0A2T6ZMS0_TUBBO|nr:hypothetical protein B9Z19DRAFT_1129211 [Tuber borchii]
MLTQQQVHGEPATVLLGATKILDLGSGGISGLGVQTHRNKDGTGLFDRDSDHAVKYAVNWLKEHGLKFVWTKQGETFVETKSSRLLGALPVMVAEMTPDPVGHYCGNYECHISD